MKNRILIVDDREDNLYLLRTLLQGHGYEVISAANGAEALDMARQDPPDLIIADILMPVMDGFALCRAWKKDELLQPIPFVFYTATYIDERDRDFALRLGAERFIVKPQEPDVFMAIIVEAIQQVGSPPTAGAEPAADAPTQLPIEPPEKEEHAYLKQYSEVLVRKLEAKMEQLERVNRELEQDIAARQKMEAALRETEERFRLLSSNTPDSTSVQDRDLRYEWVVNPALGLTPEDFIGKTDADLVDAEQFEMLHALKQQVMDSGEALHVEVPLTDAHGTVTVYDGTYVPRRDAEGNVTGILSYFKDITERKRAEDLLARYQLLSSEARDIMLFVRSSDGAIVEANAAAEAAYGYSREGLLSLTINDIRPTLDGPTIDIQMKAAEAEGILFETEHHRKDGSSFPVEVSSRGATMIDGEKVLLSVIRDITERKHAEAALIESTAQLKRTLQAAVAALGATTELRDPYTAGHQRRVAELAGAIAAEIGWEDGRIETLRTAALLHDIGKIVVPAEILSRPGRLGEVEMQLIREHVAAGAQALADIDFKGSIANIVRQHHERLDGSGYPAGLRDAQIILEARVLAVADVVEAMISHRPYRPALTLKEALAELEDGAGRRYDAEVCVACIRLFQERGFALAD